MNILYTESSPNMGGQEIQAISQMKALISKGHSITLACKKGSKISFLAENSGIKISYISFRNSIDLFSVFKLLKIVYRFLPDIIVCHSGHDSNIVGIVRLLLFISQRRPLVVRQKTYTTNKMKSFSLNYMNDVVIVPGNEIKEKLVNSGCRENKIKILPPGFDFKKMRREFNLDLPAHIKSWLKNSGNDPVIIQVGMLRPEKSHDFMLQVLEQLKHEGKGFRYLIIGGGKAEIRKVLQHQIIDKNLWDRVYMAGEVYPIMPVYRYADLVVVPSRNESFGMTAVEASSVGVPVFASRVGGLPDIIRNDISGTLLPVDNKSLWVSALCDFLNKPDFYKRLAKQAETDVEKHFDIQNVVMNILYLKSK
ncbi:glycosyltransferase family 4 protein [Salmonella enterica subsp. houtenae serovar 44:z36,[z38]:-]|uniref:Glycosyltransferase family 4 protein n=2 Tax=Salmonella enterica TaxID=28901 RepID=A0A736I7Z7_SALHO|nr:glycosyltransferase family 4 protein [Salmonella enterica subsp. houtenae]EEC1176496.1 glycosyltransferase [Salmonella enterica]EHM8759218.1 glycosyltransferase family 4 protein [Salmonella enterica subsp. houtenae serovar 44:z36,[z38]:-]HAE7581348.1 glycosyltransferase family 4 protein [Salmonella enterica subsp. houtenae serovar 44:z36[z38]:-]HCM6269235.1 glycosyltransferase family 4 protein [Salmonella enterica subsp. houtenae serovar 44:z36,Z38:-]